MGPIVAASQCRGVPSHGDDDMLWRMVGKISLHVPLFLPAPVPQVQVFFEMGEEQLLMEMEGDIL